MIDWDDPIERLALIRRVGPDEYNRLHADYRAKSIVSTVAGHAIRPVGTRFGRLYHVGDTKKAFSTLAQAEDYAKTNPK